MVTWRFELPKPKCCVMSDIYQLSAQTFSLAALIPEENELLTREVNIWQIPQIRQANTRN